MQGSTPPAEPRELPVALRCAEGSVAIRMGRLEEW